jgi:hypothetical protein
MNSMYVLIPYVFKVHFNIILRPLPIQMNSMHVLIPYLRSMLILSQIPISFPE